MNVASLFGPRHPAHVADIEIAVTAARGAHLTLASVFIATIVGFTLLRVAGLKRVLVPRSGIIGLGVGWSIVSGVIFSLKASDTAVLAFAPGTPPHTLVVVFPAQMAFLGSLVKRKLVTKAHAFRLAFVFLFGLFMLCLARGIGASEPETIIGAKRKDSTHEELDVVGTTVDVLIALARAAAGGVLILAGSERSDDKAKDTKDTKDTTDLKKDTTKSQDTKKSPMPFSNTVVNTSSRQELFLSCVFCLLIVFLSPPRFGGETAWGDALGGNVLMSTGRVGNMVSWYVLRCTLVLMAHWAGLFVVKLAPGQYKVVGGETKKEESETKKDR